MKRLKDEDARRCDQLRTTGGERALDQGDWEGVDGGTRVVQLGAGQGLPSETGMRNLKIVLAHASPHLFILIFT